MKIYKQVAKTNLAGMDAAKVLASGLIRRLSEFKANENSIEARCLKYINLFKNRAIERLAIANAVYKRALEDDYSKERWEYFTSDELNRHNNMNPYKEIDLDDLDFVEDNVNKTLFNELRSAEKLFKENYEKDSKLLGEMAEKHRELLNRSKPEYITRAKDLESGVLNHEALEDGIKFSQQKAYLQKHQKWADRFKETEAKFEAAVKANKPKEYQKFYNQLVKLSEAGSKKSLTLPWIHGERGPFRQWAINMHKGDVTSTYAEYFKLDFDKYLKKSLEDLVNELK